MATIAPQRYGQEEEEYDPYGNDGTRRALTDSSSPTTTAPRPQSYAPPPASEAQPPQTFAQMQAAGVARPPAPTAQAGTTSLLSSAMATEPDPSRAAAPESSGSSPAPQPYTPPAPSSASTGGGPSTNRGDDADTQGGNSQGGTRDAPSTGGGSSTQPATAPAGGSPSTATPTGRDQYGAMPGERDHLALLIRAHTGRDATAQELNELSSYLPTTSWEDMVGVVGNIPAPAPSAPASQPPAAPPTAPPTAPAGGTSSGPASAPPAGAAGRDQYGAGPGERDQLAQLIRNHTGRDATPDELNRLSGSLATTSWADMAKLVGEIPVTTSSGSGTPAATGGTGGPAAGGGGATGDGTSGGTSGPPTSPPVGAPPVPAVIPPPAETTSTDLLTTLLGGATNQNQTPLAAATNAATVAHLNSPSPFNSKEVRNEYDWSAGNIDDDYDTRQRQLDDQMAARGLYGSAGKDFHSGRLSDLNVGRRTAKTTLARDLDQKYAQSYGDYLHNAIAEGQTGTNAENANQLNWVNALMGYGDTAFNHDLATAQFNEGQDIDYEKLLQAMLAAGYGA